jgi:A/G-specific adenine glycosylase
MPEISKKKRAHAAPSPLQDVHAPGDSQGNRAKSPASGRLRKERASQDSLPAGALREGCRSAIHAQLLAWYHASRRDLPWRRTRDPYRIWVSEVMLQQTRVDTVIPYYDRFLTKFPTVEALASAPLEAVLTSWSGLGYYRRARMLHAGAQEICRDLGAKIPESAEGLREVRGIGPYTAGAIASIAFGEAAALVDGNVARVLSRVFAVEDDVRAASGLRRIWKLAEWLVAEVDPSGWNQGLMELGATVCLPQSPRCLLCPIREHCEAHRRGLTGELPRVGRKAAPRIDAAHALVAEHGDAVLLGRRKLDGRFGGMWEPPLVDDAGGSARPDFGRVFGLRLVDLVEVGRVTHVLTHRRMEVRVHRARLADPAPSLDDDRVASPPEGLPAAYDTLALVRRDRLTEKPLTTFARKVLAEGTRGASPIASSASGGRVEARGAAKSVSERAGKPRGDLRTKKNPSP